MTIALGEFPAGDKRDGPAVGILLQAKQARTQISDDKVGKPRNTSPRSA